MNALKYIALFPLLTIVFSVSILFIVPTHTAHAECATGVGGFVPLECFSQSPKLKDAYTNSTDLKTFFNRLFVGAISLGGVLAVLRLAWAGFVYMGTDMWGKKEHAKEVITDTLLGLFLLLAIYLILNQINPQILDLTVTATPPQSESQSYPSADAFGPIEYPGVDAFGTGR